MKIVFIVTVLFLIGLSVSLAARPSGKNISNLFSFKTSNPPPESPPPRGQVLADTTKKLLGKISFNIPTVFNDTVDFKKAVTFDGSSTFNGPIKINNQDVDIGTGKLTAGQVIAPNLIYGITAGNGISVALGTGQKPIVTNTGVLSVGGQTGAITLTAGSGISINGTTISNTSQGGNSFGKIVVGGDTISAGSTSDTVTLVAGSGVALSADTSNNKVTITSTGGLSGLTTNGVMYATSNTTAGTITPGTTGYFLQSNGSGTPPSWVAPSALSTVSFDNITTGTNTTATMTVGSGGTLTFGGTGVLNANQLLGGTWAVPGAIGSTTPNTGVFTTLTGTTVNALSLTANADGFSIAGGTTSRTLNVTGSNITLTGGGNTLTLTGNASLNQSVLTSSSPTFSNVTLSGFSTNGGLLFTNGSGVLSQTGAGSSTTVLHGGTTPSYSAVSLTAEVSGILPIANGGTNTSSVGSAGSLPYSTGTAYGFSTVGSAGQCLISGGSGVPTWTACAAGSTFWDSTNGALYPNNSTLDLLIGGTATSSAKFAVTNMNSGTPIASLSAGANGGLYMTADGILATTTKQTLTIGSSTTGNVVINGFSTGLVHSNVSGILSSSAVNLASADVTGILAVGNGGTGVTTFTSNGLLYGNGSSAVQVTSAGTNGTVLHGNTGSAPTFSAVSLTVDVSGILPLANGGTNANLTAANGAIAYSNASALALSSVGTSGQCLLSGGAGTPTWGNCTTGGGTNFWTSTNGSLYPINSTMDLFVGGNATASAKFAVTNINSGIPTASVSAGTNGGLYVTADGTLATTAKQTLTLGSTSTGNVVLNGFSAGIVHTNASGVISSSAVNLAGSDVTGTLPVGNGGTGGTSFTSNGVVVGNGSGAFQITAAGTTGTVLHGNTGSAPTFSAISLTADVTGILPLANGGTNANLTAVNGGIVYSGSSALAISAAGTSGQCLSSGGAGTPTWINCASGTNYWTSTNGSVYPINATLDLFVGGTATASAKFAVLNVNSGTPTASVSAGTNGGLYVTADGTLATTAKQTLTIGSSSTGNIAINGFSTGLVHANASGVLSSSAVNLASADVTGTLVVGNGGTGATTFTSNGIIYGNGSSALQITAAGTNGTVLHGNTGGAPTFSAVSLTADVTGILPLANGGTNANTIGGAGSLAYSTGTAYAFSSAGTSGQCLTSGGTGAPSWTTCAAGSNLWTTTAGAIYPIDTTADLLVGGTATASAKFAFINVSSGIPTASVSAGAAGGTYLTADGVLATTAKQSLTLGSGTTGNVVLNGFGNGVVHTNSVGFLSTSAVNLANADVTGILPLANGGTNANLTAANGGIVYSGSSALAISSVGTSGQCLVSGGAGAPTWINCASGTNYWTSTNGSVYPINATLDLFVGGTATSSAKFAVLNVNSGTPIASVSAGTNGGLYVTADGTLATTAKQTLTLGSSSTGNIAINGFSTGLVHANASGILSSSAVNLASADVTGTLAVGNGGTGATSFTSNGLLYGNGSSAIQVTAAGTTGTVLHGNTGSAPTFSAVSLTTDVSGILPLANGGTNANLTAANGAIAYSDASALALSSVGTSGQCLLSGGAGTPTWGNCTTGGGTNYWTSTNGSLYPVNSTMDLFVGGTATASAKFAVLNVNSGTTIASISAGTTALTLAGDGTIQSVRNNTLTVGGNTTGDIQFKPGNSSSSMYLSSTGNVGVGTTTPSDMLQLVGGSIQLDNNQAIKSKDSGGNSRSVLLYTTINNLQLFNAATTGNVQIGNINSSNNSANNGTVMFYTRNIERARLDANGSLGIGSTSPLATLDVRANIATTPVASFAGATTFATLVADNSGTGDIFTASSSGLTRFVITQNGNVGIGKTNPTATLDITGSLKTSGTNTFSALSTGIGHLDSSGVLSSSAVNLASADVSGILPLANGGTNANLTAVNGGIVYSGASALAISAAGTSGQCLLSGGAGTPTWGSCTTGGGTNLWTTSNGAIYPINSTEDLFVGGTATASAKFAVLNINSGTPTSSVSAGAAGGTFVTADGKIATTAKQSLTLGDANTGNIIVPNGNVGIGTTTPTTKLAISDTGNSVSSTTITVDAPASFTGNFFDFKTNGTSLLQLQSYSNAGNLEPRLYATGSETGGTAINIGNSNGYVRILPYNDGSIYYQSSQNTMQYTGINGAQNSLLSFKYSTTYFNGAVTIGATADPVSKLDITGGVSIGSYATVNAAPTNGLIVSGNVGIGTSSLLSTFDVRGNSGTIAVASVSGQSSFAAMVVDNKGTGDIFTASSSGLNRFVITQNGNIGIGKTNPTATVDITGSLTTSGTNTFSALGTGLVHSNSSGVLSSSAVNLANADVSGILPLANGGTNANLTAVNGGIVYSGASALAISAAGTSGQCFLSGGAGTPTWGSCTTGGGTNLWTTSNGAIYPINATEDLFVGGSATTSAKFAVLNVNSGTTTASVSAGTSALTLAGDGTIQSVRNNSLTIGGNATGNIILQPQNGSGNVGIDVASPVNYLTVKGEGTGIVQLGLNGCGSNYAAITLNKTTTSANCLDYNIMSSPTDRTLYVNRPSGADTVFQEAGGTAQLFIAAGGNVGIGTTIPTAKLDVNGTASISGQLALYGTPTIQSVRNNTLTIGGNTTGNIVLNPQNGTGNVGIGINAPTAGLDVETNLSSAGTILKNSGSGHIVDFSNSSQVEAYITTFGSLIGAGVYSPFNNVSFCTSGCGSVTMQTGGQAIIGTYNSISALGTLDVRSALGTVSIASLSGATSMAGLVVDNSGSGDIFTASSSGLNRFVITQNGNVGIGKTNPTATLDITGSLTTSGTNTFSALGTGLVHANSSGVLSSSAVNLANADVTGILSLANGGTNANLTAANGAIAYSNASALALSSVGTSGQCLLSGGAGTPTWGSCSTGTNLWTTSNGAIYPINSTEDLFVGGTATTSAKFAVLNVNSGVPTASVSAGTNGGSYLTADGTLQTTANQTMTLGGTTTGNIILAPLNYSGNVGVNTANPTAALDVASVLRVRDYAESLNGYTFNAYYNSGWKYRTSAPAYTWQSNINANKLSLEYAASGTAGNAATLNDGIVLDSSNGFVGLGTSAPGQRLEVNGNIYANSSGNTFDIISRGATSNYAALQLATNGTNKWTIGTRNDSTENLSFYDEVRGTNVLTMKSNTGTIGVGTTNPLGTLDVRSQSGTLPTASLSGSTANAGLVVDNSGTGDLFTASSSGLSRFVITQNGNVGVGTTVPTRLMDIAGTAVENSNGSASQLSLRGTGSTTNKLNIGYDTTQNAGYLEAVNENVAWQNLMLQPSGGNVGIGTSMNAPVAAFQVGTNGGVSSPHTLFVGEYNNGGANGGAQIMGGMHATNGWGIGTVNNTTGDYTVRLGLASSAGAGTWASTQNIKVLIGGASVTNGLGTLDVRAGTGTLAIASLSGATSFAGLVVDNSGVGDIFTASSSGLNRFVITQNGNVGIGKTNPTATLDITGSLKTSGTNTFSALSTGIGHLDSSGVLSSSAVNLGNADVTGTLLTSNGGTGLSSYTAGDMTYYSSGTAFSKIAIGSNGTCLTSNGTTPSWGSCSGGTNYWTSTNGALYPINSTMDLFVGGTATTSAKFAVLNVNSGTPTASISAGTSGAAYLTAAGTLQTTANQTLTLGGSTTGNVIFNQNGNVGIGITNPLAPLSVVGKTNAGIQITQSNTNDSLAFINSSSSNKAWSVYGSGNDLRFWEYDSTIGNGTGNVRMAFQAGGNVGIGTLTPTAKLDVNGTASVSGQLALYGTPTIQSTANQTLTIGGNTTGTIILKPSNNNGNVGIDTTNPQDPLDVNGNIRITASSGGYFYNADSSAKIKGLFNGAGDWLGLQSDSSNVFSFSDKGVASNSLGTPVLAFKLNGSGGNVGIGTISPDDNLSLYSAGSGGTYLGIDSQSGQSAINFKNNGTAVQQLGAQNDGSFFAYDNGLGRDFIEEKTAGLLLQPAGGNVGVGTANPQGIFETIANGVWSNLEGDTNGLQTSTGHTNSTDYTLYMGADKTNGLSYIQSVQWGVDTAKLVLNARGGNVGVGTSNPSDLFDVTASTTGEGLSVFSPNKSLSSSLYYDGAHIVLAASGQSVIFGSSVYNAGGNFDNGNNPLFDISQFGVGTSNMLATADIRATSGTIAIASVSGSTSLAGLVVDNSGKGDIFTASSSGLNRFVINQNGNVGIGTASAKAKLDVEGGNIMIGQQPNTGSAAETTWTRVSQSTAGTIANGGTSGIASISAMAVYNGSLYVGTYKDIAGSAEVYRYDGSGTSWTKVSQAPGTIAASGTANIASVSAMAVYNGSLYIGTSKMNGAEVYRYDGGTSWTKMSAATAGTIRTGGTANIDQVSSLVVYHNTLFAGTTEPHAAELYKFADTQWWPVMNTTSSTTPGTVCESGSTTVDGITAMAVFNDYLFIGTRAGATRAELCRYEREYRIVRVSGSGSFFDDYSSSNITNLPVITSLVVYDGALYIAFRKGGATQLLRYDGAAATAPAFYNDNSVSTFNSNDFTSIINGNGNINGGTGSIQSVSAMTVYNGHLYIGTEKTNAAELYRYETGSGVESQWTKVSQATAGTVASGGTANIDMISSLIPYNGNLYAGTYEPGNAEVYSFNVVSNQSYALQFHAFTTQGAGEQGGNLSIGQISFVASPSASYNSSTGNNGQFVFSNAITTSYGAYDVAEDYPTRDDTLEPGDIVQMDPYEETMVEKATQSGSIVGIFSEKPGLRLSQLDDTINGGRAIPVALAGRVPVKVSAENGAIHIGDMLTPSSIRGVAMKATKPGLMVARAFENYDPSDKTAVGKIMAFVTITWADPGISLTDNGNFNIADQLNTVIPTVQNISTGSAALSMSDDQLSATDKITLLTGNVNDLQAKISSFSAQLDSLKDTMTTIDQRIATATGTAIPSLADTFGSATISGQLNVAGRSLFNDVGITGTVNMGLLTINGMDTTDATPAATINTLTTPLKIQSLALAGVDFENGKVTIDTDGNIVTQGTIKANEVTTKHLNVEINKGKDDNTIGEGTVKAGTVNIVIPSTEVTATSKVFVTPRTKTGGQALIVTDIKEGKSFSVEIEKSIVSDIDFDWWIVN